MSVCVWEDNMVRDDYKMKYKGAPTGCRKTSLELKPKRELTDSERLRLLSIGELVRSARKGSTAAIDDLVKKYKKVNEARSVIKFFLESIIESESIRRSNSALWVHASNALKGLKQAESLRKPSLGQAFIPNGNKETSSKNETAKNQKSGKVHKQKR